MDDAQETAVAGIRAKLSRANSQLDRLHHEMGVFNDTEPYTTGDPKTNADRTQWVYPLKILRPMPLMWAVVLGEIVHNLRSALDQSIFQLTLDYIGHELPGTGFPISNKAGSWDIKVPRAISADNPIGFAKSCSMYQIRGVGPGVVDYITRLQPNSAQYPHKTPLAALQSLWNQDKHRLIHFWGLQLGQQEGDLRIEGGSGAYTLKIDEGILQSGDDAITLTFEAPATNVKLVGKLATKVAFENPVDPGPGPDDRLWRLYDASAGIVGMLLAALGHQDDPIP